MLVDKTPWYCRVAPSLGDLEEEHEDIWGTVHYDPHYHGDDQLDGHCVFFGLYGLPDFFRLWKHRGPKAILWAGSDIKHFVNGYWLDEEGQIKLDPEPLAKWINENCESYVENGVEAEALRVLGIESRIVPSFLGHTETYNIEFKPQIRPQVYASVSGDNFAMYGWELIEMIADKCYVDFHLYGNTTEWVSKHSNVYVHGRVPKDVMNKEIKHMQAGLRPLEFDGFSEILAKSVLWGQYPISRIGYPHIDSYQTNEELIALLNSLVAKMEPNEVARNYYLKQLNAYPWNENY